MEYRIINENGYDFNASLQIRKLRCIQFKHLSPQTVCMCECLCVYCYVCRLYIMLRRMIFNPLSLFGVHRMNKIESRVRLSGDRKSVSE